MYKIRLLVICLMAAGMLGGISTFSATALAGAWTLPENQINSYSKLIISEAFFDFNEEGQAITREGFSKTLYEELFEWGVRDWATLSVKGSFVDLRDVDFDIRAQELNDSEVGLRIRLAQAGAFVLSWQNTAILPGTGSPEDTSAVTVIGSGEFGAESRLAAGYSWQLFGFDTYINAEAGYRLVGGPRSDEVRADLSVGVKWNAIHETTLQSFNIIGVGTADIEALKTRSHKLQVSQLRWLTENIAVEMGAFQTVAGQNVPGENGAFAALWLRF